MRITGGDFGVGGKASVDNDRGLVVSSAVNAVIPFTEISRATASEHKEKTFSVLGFLFFGVAGMVVGFLLLGFIGAAIGMVIAIALSFNSSTTIRVIVETIDGKHLEAEGWHYEVQKLIKAVNSQR